MLVSTKNAAILAVLAAALFTTGCADLGTFDQQFALGMQLANDMQYFATNGAPQFEKTVQMYKNALRNGGSLPQGGNGLPIGDSVARMQNLMQQMNSLSRATSAQRAVPAQPTYPVQPAVPSAPARSVQPLRPVQPVIATTSQTSPMAND